MNTKKRIVALGFFDGVHLGHQALLAQCVRLAAAFDMETAAITFEAHPKSLFLPEPPALINTREDRLRLLGEYGMDRVFTYPVTKAAMSTPWREFLNGLVEEGAAGFVCGDDFRFGNRGQGDAQRLREFCEERGFPCVIVPEQTLDGVRISSTHIRGLLETGRMEEAARFLGHPHRLTGEVVSGRHLGHKLGFPTANILIPEGIVCPRHGVYACKARVDGQVYLAVTNVGSRPTVEGHQVRAESWLLDFDGDLYGRTVNLLLFAFLRPERRFDSLEALKAAVLADAEKTREYFAIK